MTSIVTTIIEWNFDKDSFFFVRIEGKNIKLEK